MVKFLKTNSILFSNININKIEEIIWPRSLYPPIVTPNLELAVYPGKAQARPLDHKPNKLGYDKLGGGLERFQLHV